MLRPKFNKNDLLDKESCLLLVACGIGLKTDWFWMHFESDNTWDIVHKKQLNQYSDLSKKRLLPAPYKDMFFAITEGHLRVRPQEIAKYISTSKSEILN